MPIENRGFNPGVREIFEKRVPAISHDLFQTTSDASARIARNINPYTLPSYFHEYTDIITGEIFVTDRPERIFGGNKTIYTVTSSLALKNVQNGNLLVPPMFHERGSRDIQTHRGIGLELFAGLTGIMGIKDGMKDYFVWLGSQVDGEQFAIEDAIARKGPHVDKEIASVFFESDDLSFLDRNSGSHPDPRLHPKLRNVLISISEGGNLYAKDPEHAEFIDHFLDIVVRDMGIRDGWYTQLEGVLKGKIPPPRKIDGDFEETLINIAVGCQLVPEKSQAVVLEIDADKLFELTPIYPFPLTSRPPGTIIPAPHVPIDAVRAVYAESVPEECGPLRDKIKPLAELPLDKWLPDSTGEPVTPAIARSIEHNPQEPLCAIRYAGDPIATWAQHLDQGDIIPWYSHIRTSGWKEPKTILEHMLQRLVLQKSEDAGILGELKLIYGQEEAIGKLFSALEHPIDLKSVREQ